MRRSARQAATSFSALSIALALTGCAAFTLTACTAVGVESSTTIALAGHKWTGSLTFEVCVGDRRSSSQSVG